MRKTIKDYYEDEWLQPMCEYGSLTIKPDPEDRRVAYIRGSAYFKEQYRRAKGGRFESSALYYGKLALKNATLINTTCACGKEVWVRPAHLLIGAVASCGCAKKQKAKETIVKNVKNGTWALGRGRKSGSREAILKEHDPIDTVAGKHSPSPTRRAWSSLMRNRLSEVKKAEGIDHWWKFADFVAELGVSPYAWPCHVGKVDAGKPLGWTDERGKINAVWREGRFDTALAVRQGNWHVLIKTYK